MKPSMRIEELYRGQEGLSKMMTDDEIEKALLWRKIVAITDFLDEQAQEPKALEEEEEWTHNLAAREMKRDFPEETAGFNLDQIAEMYSEWSEENYCAGWMAPCKEYVARCFGKAKPQEEPKEEAIRYLKLILPMAKGYAAKNDAGSNQAYIEEVERFIKSQE